MPFRDSEEKDSSQKQFVVLNNSRNKLNFIPIFTDNIEFQRFRMQFKEGKELKLMAAGFSNLADMKLPEKVEGFVINPFTTAVPLPQAYIKKVDGQRKA